MKEMTKLIKKLGEYLLGSKGKTRTKIFTEKYRVILFETENKKVLGLEYDVVNRSFNIFREFDPFDAPTYRIPRWFTFCDYKFGNCPICGNLAIISTQGPERLGTCIEPPNFHRFDVGRKREARE
jgi:hypothetical protein